MVRSAFTALALLAVCHAVGAAPTAEVVTPSFSFADWVEGIIANPQGDHLTPEQAIEAFNASRNSTSSSEHTKRGPLDKRVPSCNEQPNTEVPIADAVACVNFLAAKGQTACVCNGFAQFCQIGQGIIDGNSGSKRTTSACNDVARAGGLILDHCTRADNTVQGSEFAYGNGDMLVRIHNLR
ncbi:hypothetical protein C8A01DRAFT_50050 [Parachaetomium inaequale]|uniref:Uncharacterized protein n=1 Tax=Parachaetomium inaequale TaxID=2588326 RepID=A0AAN6PBI9_9PEZI|nr:hypothetical protein C8A01DRAFT_50050 [Parachaetomium inaequale]